MPYADYGVCWQLRRDQNCSHVDVGSIGGGGPTGASEQSSDGAKKKTKDHGRRNYLNYIF